MLEGVMMKNKERYAVAVRKPDQTIRVITKTYNGIGSGTVLPKIPIIRGVLGFIDSLVLGMSTLFLSASLLEEDSDESQISGAEIKQKDKVLFGLTGIVSFCIAVLIFVLLPYYLSQGIKQIGGGDTLAAVLEGIIRIALFILYIALISRMKDIKRTFMYHGAEHKCISCIESGLDLTVENVRKSSKEHKRCGTSFLMFVVIVSVILFMFIRTDSPVLRVVLRLILVPLIAGISYEILRLAGSSDSRLIHVLSKPGLWLQRLTTSEPDDAMIEVGIRSVTAVFDWKQYVEQIRQEAINDI